MNEHTIALADAVAERVVALMSDSAELPDPDRWMTQTDAAAFLGFAEKTLEDWRYRGEGPIFSRVGARGVRYRRRDLIDWMLSHRVEG